MPDVDDVECLDTSLHTAVSTDPDVEAETEGDIVLTADPSGEAVINSGLGSTDTQLSSLCLPPITRSASERRLTPDHFQNFVKGVRRRSVLVLGFRDFVYKGRTADGALRPPSEWQLEREYWFQDGEGLVVLHAHFSSKWSTEQSKSIKQRDVTCVLQVNVRHTRLADAASSNPADSAVAPLMLPGMAIEARGDEVFPLYFPSWKEKQDFHHKISLPPSFWEWQFGPVAGVKLNKRSWEIAEVLSFGESCDQVIRKKIAVLVEDLSTCKSNPTARLCTQSYISALCIGVNDYKHEAILANGVADASAFANKLESVDPENTLQVLKTADQTALASMWDGIDSFVRQCQTSTPRAMIFFFAGHGLQIAGRNYLLPSDANCTRERDVKMQCLDLEDIVKEFKLFDWIPKVFILDCCRVAPFDSSWMITSKSVEQLTLPPNSKLVFAATGGQAAADGGTQANSPFTTSLLAHFFEPGVSLSQAIDNSCVRARTGKGQQPTSYGSLPQVFLHPSGASTDVVAALQDIPHADAAIFEPDGGIFVGRVVVKVSSTTPGSTLQVDRTAVGSAISQRIVPLPVAKTYPPGFMQDILNTYAVCAAHKKRLFKKMLCSRYPFVIRPKLYVYKPHFLIFGNRGARFHSDYCLRYVVYVDEVIGLPALRFSTTEERMRFRRRMADCIQLTGTTSNTTSAQCLGLYRKTSEKSGGRHVFKHESAELFIYLNTETSSWHVGPNLEQEGALLRLARNKKHQPMTADQEPGVWQERVGGGSWSEQPNISVEDATFVSNIATADSVADPDVSNSGESPLEFALERCGVYSLNAVVSKSGMISSEVVASNPFTIVTWEALPTGFAFDVLDAVSRLGVVSEDFIRQGVEHGQIYPLPDDCLCDLACALRVLSDGNAFSGYTIPVVPPRCICFTASDEVLGPLLAIDNEEEIESGHRTFRATRAGLEYLRYGRSFLGLISGALEDYGMPGFQYWDMGLISSLWGFRLITVVAISCASLANARGGLDDGSTCTVTSIVLGGVLFALTVVVFVVTVIRQSSSGSGVWWQNAVSDVGLVWECAAMGYSLDVLGRRKPPAASQLGYCLTHRRRRLAAAYTAVVLLYMIMLPVISLWPSWTASEGACFALQLFGPLLVACDMLILLFLG